MASAENNKTEPASGAYLRVLQITDTHLFGDTGGRLVGMDTDASSLEVLEKALSEFWPADLVLATGDIVHDGSEIGYRRFKERFERLGVPTLVIPGNHDDPAVLQRVMRSGLVTAAKQFVVGAWHFVMLDSTLRGEDGGHLAEDQLALLDRALAQYPQHHSVICLHHHPVSVDCQWIDTIGVNNPDPFFAIVDRHPQVRAIVWGHIHQDFMVRRNGVELIATPSTCIQFKPREDNFALDDMPPGFRWFKLFADGRIETEVVRVAAHGREVDLRSAGYT